MEQKHRARSWDRADHFLVLGGDGNLRTSRNYFLDFVLDSLRETGERHKIGLMAIHLNLIIALGLTMLHLTQKNSRIYLQSDSIRAVAHPSRFYCSDMPDVATGSTVHILKRPKGWHYLCEI